MSSISIRPPGESWVLRGIGGVLNRISALVASVERKLVITFVGGIFLLILLNIVTRAIGKPLIWVDEASIFLMVMTCFVGTSLTVRQRLDFAMTLVLDHLDTKMRTRFNRILAVIVVAYAFFIVWCCWRLFDPLELWRHGFDTAKYATASMNFVYTEPTQTLGIAKWWVYLVLPLYGLGISIHSLANLWEDFGWTKSTSSVDLAPIIVEAG